MSVLGRGVAAAGGLFVGRDRELGVLRRAMQRASHGAGGVALVAGEPGVGKTRLVEEAVAGCDGTVVWATCAQGGAPAYWPWVQLLRGCVGPDGPPPVVGAVPELRVLLEGRGTAPEISEDASRFRLFEGVAGVLGVAARSSPLVLVLDDLQWADEASIRLLRFCAGAARGVPVLTIGTYRDTELDLAHPLATALAELARAGDHITLGGLDRGELLELVRASADVPVDAGPDIGEALHEQTGGNPYFARELACLLDSEGRRARRHVELAQAVRGGVGAVIDRRLARLPQPTHDLLSWAALIGRRFDAATLAAVTDRKPYDVVAVLEPAVAARMVAQADDAGFRFVHDLVRETLAGSLGVAERTQRHHTIGSAFAASVGDDPERVTAAARHLVAGVLAGDVDEAVRWAIRAAERSNALLAYEDAAEWYDRALRTRRSVASGNEEDLGLLLALGGARLDAGDLDAARDAFEQAAGVARRRGDSEKLAAAALGLGAGFGGFEVSLFDQAQIDLLEEALTAVPQGDSSMRAWVSSRLSVALSFVAGDDRRSRLSKDAVAIARRLGDDAALAYALAAWCDAFSGPDDVVRRLAAAEEIMELSLTVGSRALELLGRRVRIVALLERGRLADAATEVDAFARVADRLRQPLYRWYVPLWRATLAMAAGELDAARRWTNEAEEVGALCSSENARILVAVQRSVRLRYEGRFGKAAEAVAPLLPDLPEMASPASLEGSNLVLDVLRGNFERATLIADRLAARGFSASHADSEWVPNLSQLADASAALSHASLATAVYDALEPYAGLFVVEGIGAGVYGCAAHYLAVCAGVLGHATDQVRHAARAEELHRAAGILPPPPGLRATAVAAGRPPPTQIAAFEREGEVWAITFAGTTTRLRDSKGLRDLAVLLRSPGSAVHVSELTGTQAAASAPDLDATALGAYRRRLTELEEDLADAEADHDVGRRDKLRAERDLLLDELSGAVGLGGRPRRHGDPVERARKAVSARLRDSIRRIGAAHPGLGRHLTSSVRTGTWCSYEPEQPVDWRWKF